MRIGFGRKKMIDTWKKKATDAFAGVVGEVVCVSK